MKKLRCAIVLVCVFVFGIAAHGDPFAVEVVEYGGLGDSPYNDPSTVLGRPTISIFDSWAGPAGADVGISMVYGTWTPDTVLSLNSGGYVTVRFDGPVYNDPLNAYGMDFIVFGNSFFPGKSGWVDADTDMAAYRINSAGGVFGSAEPMVVSVSQDGTTWYTFTSKTAGEYWPTQAFAQWDAVNGQWDPDSIADFTRPMNPDLLPISFGNLTVAEALLLYDGSAGGTAFDIGELGLDWIEYVRVEGKGNIDAFARASAENVNPVPEPASAAVLLIGIGLFARRRLRR